MPVFQILGSNYKSIDCFSIPGDSETDNDGFTKLNINYADATATIKVGTSIKAESQLIIFGTKGYAYVPAPWWKTDYFELRYEDSNQNKRYFYQVDGEGIRYELVQLARAIHEGNADYYIDRETSRAIVDVFETVEKKA